MAVFIRKIEVNGPEDDGPDWCFFCPGCRMAHGIWTTRRTHPKFKMWGFNGDQEKPTIFGSILVTIGHGAERPDVCHSTVTAGQITFCPDSTHKLSGKTAPLEPFPGDF